MPRKIKKYAPNEKRPRGRRADGRIATTVTVGHDADNKPITKCVYGYTKGELAAAKAEVKRIYITGSEKADREVLFGVYAQRWFNNYIIPNLSPSGIKDYINTLNVHIVPVFGERQVRSIAPMDIMEFLNQKATKYSKSIIEKLYLTFKQIFRLAVAQYIIDRDPMITIKVPDAPEHKRRALTEAERRAVIHVGLYHPDGLLLLILYCTGVRIGEAVGFQGRDINLQTYKIKVCRDIDFGVNQSPEEKRDGIKADHVGELKSESATRELPIVPMLHKALRDNPCIGETYQIRGARSGSYLNVSSLQYKWNRLMTAMYEFDPIIEARTVSNKFLTLQEKDYKGKPGPKQKDPAMRSILTPHYFRHNFATMLYDAGVDLLTAQRLMGHKDVKTLLEVYTHLSDIKERSNTVKLDSVFVEIN